MTVLRGRQFLQVPGPTNVPQRVLNALHQQPIDVTGPEFAAVARRAIDDLRPIFKTDGRVYVYIANGHGAWEAAIVNVLSPGDKVLIPGTGNFSRGWGDMARALAVEIEEIDSDWRHAIDADKVEARLRADAKGEIKAVLAVHTDTATAVTSDIAAVRAAIDAAGHPALLLADTIASLGITDFRMDEWGVDVAVGASQKGLMCPPGLSFTAVSDKALAAADAATTPRRYWDWRMRELKETYRWFCGTGPVNLIFGLREALLMIEEEGLDTAFARHRRLADAVRAAVEVWAEAGAVELNALVPAERANSVTTILLTRGHDGGEVRRYCREQLSVSLGGGLGQLEGRAFRIGHMGDVNEPMILGTLGCVEATMTALGIPYGKGGVSAAVESLAASLPAP